MNIKNKKRKGKDIFLDQLIESITQDKHEFEIQLNKEKELGAFVSSEKWKVAKCYEQAYSFVTTNKYHNSNLLLIDHKHANTDMISCALATLNQLETIFDKYFDYIPSDFLPKNHENLSKERLYEAIAFRCSEPIQLFNTRPSGYKLVLNQRQFDALTDEQKEKGERVSSHINKRNYVKYYFNISKKVYEDAVKRFKSKEKAAKNGYQFLSASMTYFTVFNIDKLALDYFPESFFEEYPNFSIYKKIKNTTMPAHFYSEIFEKRAQLIIDSLVEFTDLKIEEMNIDKASYSPHDHQISVPKREYFASSLAFLATTLHECCHSTMNKISRKHIKIPGIEGFEFGSEAYAFEELQTEIAVKILFLKWGIATTKFSDNYIKNWLSAITKNESEFRDNLYKAKKDAERTVNFINSTVEKYLEKHKLNYEKEYGLLAIEKLIDDYESN